MEDSIYEIMNEIEDEHWWYVSKRNIIHYILKYYLPDISAESKILEIGCCTGGNLKYFSNYYNNISGLEVNKTAIKYARIKTNNKMQIMCGLLPFNMDIKENDYNLIFMLDVLEHIEDDQAAIDEVYRIIGQNGYLAITVPAFQFLWSKNDVINDHKRRYTIKQLIKLGEKANFHRIVFSTYYNLFLSIPIVIIRLFNKIFKIENNELDLPNKLLNKILIKIMSFERFLLKYIKFPFGISAIIILKK
jgi:SAM-dependent methyltransferase